MQARIVLITPSFFPSLTGNAVTVDRLRRGLSGLGIACRVVDLQRLTQPEVMELVADYEPQLIHNFHAYKAGRIGRKIKAQHKIPMITSMTGTDINIDIDDPLKSGEIMEVLANSDRITVFNDQAQAVLAEKGISAEKITVIHQSVSLPPQREVDFRRDHDIPEHHLVFLLLGAIRKVKGLPQAIEAIEKVQSKNPRLTLLIVGESAEQEEFALVQERIKNKSWIKYLGTVSRDQIAGLFKCADLLVNASFSESESNAMLEAMYCSRPVLARDIPGNRSLVNEDNGMLFSCPDDLLQIVQNVLNNPHILKDKGLRAKDWVTKNFRFEQEISAYLALYRGLL